MSAASAPVRSFASTPSSAGIQSAIRCAAYPFRKMRSVDRVESRIVLVPTHAFSALERFGDLRLVDEERLSHLKEPAHVHLARIVRQERHVLGRQRKAPRPGIVVEITGSGLICKPLTNVALVRLRRGSASSLAVWAPPAASALYNPSRSPMSTDEAVITAPTSLRKRPIAASSFVDRAAAAVVVKVSSSTKKSFAVTIAARGHVLHRERVRRKRRPLSEPTDRPERSTPAARTSFSVGRPKAEGRRRSFGVKRASEKRACSMNSRAEPRLQAPESAKPHALSFFARRLRRYAKSSRRSESLDRSRRTTRRTGAAV